MQVNGDSIVAFTTLQVKKINLFRVDFENCLEVSDSLRSNLKKADRLIFEQNNLSLLKDSKINDLQTLNTNKDIIISDQTKDILKLAKKVDRRGTTIKILGGGLIVSTSIALGLILFN